jgi:hypothetical protein
MSTDRRIPQNTAEYARWLGGEISRRYRPTWFEPDTAMFLAMALEGYANWLDQKEAKALNFTVTAIFLNVTWNLPRHSIRATSRFEFADVTILLVRAVTTRAASPDAGAPHNVGAPELNQFFSTRADIAVGLGIEREV